MAIAQQGASGAERAWGAVGGMTWPCEIAGAYRDGMRLAAVDPTLEGASCAVGTPGVRVSAMHFNHRRLSAAKQGNETGCGLV